MTGPCPGHVFRNINWFKKKKKKGSNGRFKNWCICAPPSIFGRMHMFAVRSRVVSIIDTISALLTGEIADSDIDARITFVQKCSEPGDGRQDIGEMVDLCHKLLTSSTLYNRLISTHSNVIILGLVSSLLSRTNLLGRREGRHEVIQLLALFFDSQCTRKPARFQLACVWTFLVRNISLPTTSTSYKGAMSLMQTSLSFAPTASIQHGRLVAMDQKCWTRPLDCTSFQVDLGRFRETFKTLEQEQLALLWYEMRCLRFPLYKSVN
jgi:hypothetical protein